MSDTPSPPADSPEPATPEAPPRPWADVQPEHFKMLRLAPLPTDRSTGARPLRFVQFGYAERHNKEQSLLRLDVIGNRRVEGERVFYAETLAGDGVVACTAGGFSCRAVRVGTRVGCARG